jgi:hypothetical protein
MNKAFVINLDADQENFDEVSKQLLFHKIESERFSAIHHLHGFVGCALSHLTLVEYAKKQHWPSIMIVEDDCLFRDNMKEWPFIKEFLETQSEDWDLFIGGTTYLQPVQWKLDHKKVLSRGVDIVQCRDVHATHFIIYHQRSYESVLGWYDLSVSLEKRPPIDVFIQQCYLRTWVPTPFIAWQKPRYSRVRKTAVNYESSFKKAEDYLAYFKLMSALSIS